MSNKSSRVRDTSPRPRGCKNYPELPCELTEKLTGTAVRAQFLQIGLDSHTTDTTPIFHILYTRGVLLMPPRVLASGPKPCGGNNYNYIIYVLGRSMWVEEGGG